MKRLLPIIVGPTGVGKTEVACHLALRLQAEIISADAYQVYQGMEVGTAQPSQEWQAKVQHHLVGIRQPEDSWNAVEFAKQASLILQNENHKFLIVGGAGFYIRALVQGPPLGSAPSAETRLMVSSKTKELGKEKSHVWLAERDPAAAQRLNMNDSQRVARALEKTFESPVFSLDFEPIGEKNVLFLGLERSRENLDQLLRVRTETMWKKGLLNETQKLLDKKSTDNHFLESTIGYAEAAAYLKKEMTEPEALEKIFRRTRQYAKRQWTWFKHQHEVQWINLDDFPTVVSIVDELEKRIKLS